MDSYSQSALIAKKQFYKHSMKSKMKTENQIFVSIFFSLPNNNIKSENKMKV